MLHENIFSEQLIIVLLVISLVTAFYKALTAAYLSLEWSTKGVWRVLAVILAWLITLSVLGYSGFFETFHTLPPRIGIALIIPLITIIILLFSEKLGELLDVIPASWLVSVQSFRIIMELFLWLAFQKGIMPIQMTFEGLNFDIIIGLTAPLAAVVFFNRGRVQKWAAVIWNVFGILMLISIMFIAFASAPTPYRLFTNEPSIAIVAHWPFVWIPGFIVPFAIAMHLFSLKQLLGRKSGLQFAV